MTQSIAAFQSELLNKIQFKTSSKVSMDAFLFKAFKFFDFSQSGALAKNDFFKAIAKCGVVVDTHDMETIYKYYAGEDGRIYYKQFIEQLLFRQEDTESQNNRLKQSQQQQPEIMPEINIEASLKQEQKPKQKLGESKIDRVRTKCSSYFQVLNLIKSNFQKEGMGSILFIAVTLKSTDNKKTHVINRKTFQSVFNFLLPEDIDLIFGELAGNSDEIDYSVLVYDLKGQLDENRLRDIQKVFNQLDNRREGEFPITYLLSRFLSKKEGGNFKRAVDFYARFQGIDDGVFTQEDFIDFMGFISSTYTSDQSFIRQIIKSFYEQDTRSVRSNRSRDFTGNKGDRVPQEQQKIVKDFSKNKQNPIDQIDKLSIHEQVQNQPQRRQVSRHSQIDKKQVSTNQVRDVESIIMRMKKRLSTKGTRGYLLFEKALKGADLNRDSLVSYDEFAQVIRQQRIDITPTQTGSLFDVFDEQETDQINYQELLATLRGNLPENRKVLIEKLWNQVKLNEETTNFGQIKHKLNFRCHPDVQNGRKYEQDLWRQIQQTILTIQELSGLTRSDTITRPQFEEYLQNLSLSVTDDQLFQSLLYNFWRLNVASNITERYAGSRKMFDPTKNGYLMDHHRGVAKGGSVSQNAPFGTSTEATNYLTEHRKL